MPKRSEVLALYQESLLDAKRVFKEPDYARHLDTALRALNEVRPQLKFTEFTLAPFRHMYACPADLVRIHACMWGRTHKATTRPWDDCFMGRLPEWRIFSNTAGARFLRAEPAPLPRQIDVAGMQCELMYTADHVLSETECTLNEIEIGLLILRAQAEAMREISAQNSTQAYQLREGISSTPKNGTPAYLYSQLIAEFEQRAAR